MKKAVILPVIYAADNLKSQLLIFRGAEKKIGICGEIS